MRELPFDAQERSALCDLFEELGANVPMLLNGWTAKDLASHLELRERDLTAGPCLVLPGRFQRFAERRRIRLAEHREFEWLVARLSGSPGELLLYIFGRQGAARVEVTGPAKAVATVRGTHFGM
jgi:hypothetical protein